MFTKWSDHLKIFCLTVVLSVFAFMIIYTALYIDPENVSIIAFVFIALLVVALVLKGDPAYRIFAWSLICTIITYLGLGIFVFIYLLTFGPHGYY
jgi:hypothetical protein